MLRIGLVGTGFIAGQKHLPALHKLRKAAEVVAVADVQVESAREFARRFRIPRVYGDLQSMLKGERLDLVDICTPPRTHAPLAVEALEAGAHVVLEKPMALSVEECDAIIAAAEKSGCQVSVTHSDLFYPAFSAARRLVSTGKIGDVLGMRIFLSTPISYMTSKPNHWAHQLPGGMIGESGPHIVYLTLAFINPILDVQVHAQKVLPQFPWSKFEDYRVELIGEEASCSATLVYTTNEWAGVVEIWGTYGLLRVDLESQTLIRYERPRLAHFDLGWSALREVGQAITSLLSVTGQVLFRRFRSTHEAFFRQLLTSIRTGNRPPVTAEEGREVIRVMSIIADRLTATESVVPQSVGAVSSGGWPEPAIVLTRPGRAEPPRVRAVEKHSPSRRLRILMVCESFYPYLDRGGFAVKVRSLSRSLVERGHGVTVVSAYRGPLNRLHGVREDSGIWRAQVDGVDAIYLSSQASYRNLTLNSKVIGFCRHQLKDFDVVHVYGLYDLLGPVVAAFCRKRGIPYLVEPMGMFRPIVRSIRLKQLYHFLLGKSLMAGSSFVIATSEMEKRELVEGGIPEAKVVVRRNGVEMPEQLPERGQFRKERGIEPSKRIVLFLSRIVSKKSPDLLLRAFARLVTNNQMGPTTLVFAGPHEGNGYHAKLEMLARQLGVADRVLFTGALYDDAKWAAYQDADIFVLPSQNENFGNSALEAMACGTPVIVTDCCGVAPIVAQGGGLVVPHEEEALHAALVKLLQDEQLRKNFQRTCPDIARSLSWSEPAEIMEALYADLVSAKSLPLCNAS